MKHSIIILVLFAACITTPTADVQFAGPVICQQEIDCTWFTVAVVNKGSVVAHEVVATMMITKDGGVFKAFKLDFGDCHPGIVESLSERVAGIQYGDDIKITGVITFD